VGILLVRMAGSQDNHRFRAHDGDMTELPPDSRPVPPPDGEATPTQAIPAEGTTATAPKQRFRDRVWGLRAMIAVALASVILGGLAGAALGSFGDHGDEGRFGPGHGRFQRGGPMGPPGMMRWKERQDFKQWQRDQQGPPGVPPSPPTPAPTPATPTPSS